MANTNWQVDGTHSAVSLTVRHMVISKVRGRFAMWNAKLALDTANLAKSSVEVDIEAASIDTGVADRDAHLRSPDFFDVAKYPTLTFRSTRVEKAGPQALKVTGDLTLHGVTKAVVLEVSMSPEVKGAYGETRRAFAATTRIDRRAFGLTWSKAVEAGPLVGDEVTITLDLEVTKQAPQTAAR